MHEIGVQALRPERQTVHQLVRTRDVERVPAHVRDFQLRIARHDAVDLAGDPAEPVGDLIFAAALGQKLHADADAEERPALVMHRLFQRRDHAVHAVEAAPAIGEGADARQHDAIGGGHHRRVVGHDDRLIVPAVARGPFERLGGGVQIARAVIDDGDAHRPRSGLGKQPDHVGRLRHVRHRRLSGGRWRRRRGWLKRRFGATHASKKRRSASSSVSPLTSPMFFHLRCESVKRRSVAASMPTSTAMQSSTSAIGRRRNTRHNAGPLRGRRPARDRSPAPATSGATASTAPRTGRPRTKIRRARRRTGPGPAGHRWHATAARGR